MSLGNELKERETLLSELDEKVKSSEEKLKESQLLNSSLVEKSEKETLEKVILLLFFSKKNSD